MTLVSGDDQLISAHRIILSSSSDFFEKLVTKHVSANPAIFIKGIFYNILNSIIEFVYLGETTLANDCLEVFLEACNDLRIKGVSQVVL